jgi:diguanylate cyclase (GGDEF)-like protein
MSKCPLRRTTLTSTKADRVSAIRACGCALALLAALLTLPSAHADESAPSVEQLLAQAEAARSADPAKFAVLLQQLDQRATQGTLSQREQIRYLDTYRKAYGGDFKGAIADLHDLFNNATDSTVRFKAAAFLINNYALTRQHSEGLVLLDGMLALLPQIHEPALRQQGLAVASFTYNQVGQYQSGLDFANMLLSENPTERTRCFANSNLFEAQFNIDAELLQDGVLRSAIDQCLASRETIGATSIRVVLARKWLREGRADAALELLDGTLEKTESTKYPPLIGGVHSLLATIRLGKKELAGAERHAQRAIEMSTGNTYALPIVDAYKVLYEISLARGDTAAALERYRKYAEADKAYLNDVKAREIAYQLARQQTEQKNQTIALLNKQNEVLRLQQQVTAQEAQNDRLRLIVVAALLLLVVGSVVFWGIKIKRLQGSLRRLAQTDTLTGVCNRHHFTQSAENHLTQAQRSGKYVALVLFDLDHFKNINDNHGHPAGDVMLRHATEMCKRHVRDGDLLGRLGGEEFAILLLGCDAAAAAEIAEGCRRHLADLRVRHDEALLQVTGSFGVACTELSGYSLKDLISHADQALYQAKRGGRNRVTVHAQAA